MYVSHAWILSPLLAFVLAVDLTYPPSIFSAVQISVLCDPPPRSPSHVSSFPCSTGPSNWLLKALGKSLPLSETMVPYLTDKIEFYQGWQICGIYTIPPHPWVKGDITNRSLIFFSPTVTTYTFECFLNATSQAAITKKCKICEQDEVYLPLFSIINSKAFSYLTFRDLLWARCKEYEIRRLKHNLQIVQTWTSLSFLFCQKEHIRCALYIQHCFILMVTRKISL